MVADINQFNLDFYQQIKHTFIKNVFEK